jgi:hypothetical protein
MNWSALWVLGYLLLFAAAAWAQRGPVEVYGHVGLFRAGSDEGSLGQAPSFGGAVTIPLTRRLAVDFDVQTARVTTRRSEDDFWTSRRTLLAPSLLYRWGSATGYVFAGGGLGGERESSLTRTDRFADWYTPGPPWREVRPRVFESEHTEFSNLYHVRVGFVASPAPRLPLRVEAYFANWHWGLRIAAGYRFR